MFFFTPEFYTRVLFIQLDVLCTTHDDFCDTALSLDLMKLNDYMICAKD